MLDLDKLEDEIITEFCAKAKLAALERSNLLAHLSVGLECGIFDDAPEYKQATEELLAKVRGGK